MVGADVESRSVMVVVSVTVVVSVVVSVIVVGTVSVVVIVVGVGRRVVMVLKTVCVVARELDGGRRHPHHASLHVHGLPRHAHGHGRPGDADDLALQVHGHGGCVGGALPPTESPSHAPGCEDRRENRDAEQHPMVMDAVEGPVGAAPAVPGRARCDDRLRDRCGRRRRGDELGLWLWRPARGWADAPTGIGATASSLRFGTRRMTTIVSSRRTMTRTNPFTTRIPTAMSSRSITLLPDPRGGVYRVRTPSSPPARAVCAKNGLAAMMAAPRALHDPRSLR